MSIIPRTYSIENLLWHEVRELTQSGMNRVLIPCGATEAHGAAGLGTDTIIPSGMAVRLAPELEALIAPPVPYGVLKSLSGYPGSISLSINTYEKLMIEIGAGLIEAGFKELIFLNGHSGNREGLKRAGYHLHTNNSARILIYDWYEEQYDYESPIYDDPGSHSGAVEAGMVIALQPEAIYEDRWNEEDAGALNPAMTAYPGPFPVILLEDGKGLPDFSTEKAEQLLKAVTEKAKSSILRILDRWNKLDL
ncbi:MAG: creatininase family protein [Candidatus Electryonea clarkiae]|nr:creatininase family protein [Candidatus Electryonea clarkiae]MDP8285636.1 creatininase family protein [Candidatus Electryonea clarkiae]